MPVFKLKATATVIKKEQRQDLVAQLAKERGGEAISKGPVIFEIPLGQTNRFDVLVVWHAWSDIPSEIRSEIILEAYKNDSARIAQALGVTYQEAIEQHVLPYAVHPMTRAGDIDPKKLKSAMLKHGGIDLGGDMVHLRFPTLAMAEEVHRKLCDEEQKGYWSIVQSPDPMF
jgi:hypothetical protein